MTIDGLILKWEAKHSDMLYEYADTSKMMTERELSECRNHLKNVLEFVEDLKKLKEE
jgi:hypothetical protein